MTMHEFDNDMEGQELIQDHGVNDDAYELNDEVGPPDLPAPKPKRVLTEAQRLAFMKGRQKMEMNRALKKQKLDMMKEDIPEPPPKRARATKPKAVADIPATMAPPKPILARSKAIPDAPPVDDGLGDDVVDVPELKQPYPYDPDETAKKIAQMVLDQIKATSVVEVPEGPVRKPRARRPPNKPTRPASAPRARRVASPSPSPEAYSHDDSTITQRSFNWM